MSRTQDTTPGHDKNDVRVRVYHPQVSPDTNVQTSRNGGAAGEAARCLLLLIFELAPRDSQLGVLNVTASWIATLDSVVLRFNHHHHISFFNDDHLK